MHHGGAPQRGINSFWYFADSREFRIAKPLKEKGYLGRCFERAGSSIMGAQLSKCNTEYINYTTFRPCTVSFQEASSMRHSVERWLRRSTKWPLYPIKPFRWCSSTEVTGGKANKAERRGLGPARSARDYRWSGGGPAPVSRELKGEHRVGHNRYFHRLFGPARKRLRLVGYVRLCVCSTIHHRILIAFFFWYRSPFRIY